MAVQQIGEATVESGLLTVQIDPNITSLPWRYSCMARTGPRVGMVVSPIHDVPSEVCKHVPICKVGTLEYISRNCTTRYNGSG